MSSFGGTLTSVSDLAGLEGFLATHSPLYKEFGAFAGRLSERIQEHAQALAAARQRPFRCLASASVSKEDLAREIMKADGITQGLVCVLAWVTRLLRLLRAHGLIRKVPSTRSYRVTVQGQQVMTRALQRRETDRARLAA